MPHLIDDHEPGRGSLLRSIAAFSLLLGERRAEQRLAKALRPLRSEGWHVLHDVQLGRSGRVCVAIGPGGVFVLETRAPCGDIKVGSDEVVRIRAPHDPLAAYEMPLLARRLRGAASRLKARIERDTSERLFVWAVAVFDEGFDQDVVEGHAVAFAARDRVAAWLRALPAHQPAAVTDRVAAALAG